MLSCREGVAVDPCGEAGDGSLWIGDVDSGMGAVLLTLWLLLCGMLEAAGS